jgi:LysM repeat protein
MTVRRLFPFLLLNVLVSAAVVLGLLIWWDGRQEDEVPIGPTGQPVAAAIAAAPTIPTLPAQPTSPPAEPTEDPNVYTVRPGDTLGSISTALDVPIEDIMAANGLDNPDFLQVDQRLIIPRQDAEPPGTETAAAPPGGAGPAPIATPALPEGESEVTIGTVEGIGDGPAEVITLVNSGARPQALLGWQLLDEHGHAYTFGQIMLFGEGAAISLHTAAGQDSSTDLYWGLSEPVWESGETATLLDATGATQATLVVE